MTGVQTCALPILFGSVTAADIAEAVQRDGFAVDKKKVVLSQPIKTVGVFDVDLKFMEGISAKIKVSVESE